MEKHLVLIGGGHAHMVTLANLHEFVKSGHQVTVIQPSEHHYYSGMGPGMLGGTYSAEEIRFATRHVVEKRGGRFVLGKVKNLNPQDKEIHLETGETLPYDILSMNAGSYIPETIVVEKTEDIYGVKPIERLIQAQSRIVELASQNPITIGIVGGGPSAVEIAGNTWALLARRGKRPGAIRVFAGKAIMRNFPEGVRRRAYQSLRRRGIEIQEGDYVQEVRAGQITTASGKGFDADFVLLALGVTPSPIPRESDLPTGPDGAMRVNQHLQCTEYPEIFGGGDCIYFQDRPLDKVGVYAVRQNPILYHNLMASLNETPLQAFDPGGNYLLIFNMGDGTGIFHKRGITFGGRPAFVIKNYIDRRFMKKFQAIE
jgi:NADH dehydrogenase FAD-containing subunit